MAVVVLHRVLRVKAEAVAVAEAVDLHRAVRAKEVVAVTPAVVVVVAAAVGMAVGAVVDTAVEVVVEQAGSAVAPTLMAAAVAVAVVVAAAVVVVAAAKTKAVGEPRQYGARHLPKLLRLRNGVVRVPATSRSTGNGAMNATAAIVQEGARHHATAAIVQEGARRHRANFSVTAA